MNCFEEDLRRFEKLCNDLVSPDWWDIGQAKRASKLNSIGELVLHILEDHDKQLATLHNSAATLNKIALAVEFAWSSAVVLFADAGERTHEK